MAQTAVQNPITGTSTAFNDAGQAKIVSDNLATAKNAVIDYSGSGLNASQASAGSAYVGATPKPGAVVSPYAVVTSTPATANFNNISNDYNNNIKPAIQTSAANSTATTAVNNTLPVIDGYNVSATPTGNQGESKATNSAGQSYYITPQQTGNSADALKSILSGSDSGTPTTTPQTPVQTAESQTGENPTTENANYQSELQQETDALSSAASNYQNIISTISAGSIPLSPAQQSLVDATNQAFNAMTQNANLKAAALSSETGGVSDKVNAMGGQLIGIASDQAAAIAKLEVGFQTENYQEKYQTITAAYSAYKDAETAKMDTLTKIHDSVMSSYQNAVQAAQAQQTFNQTVFKDAATLAQNQYEFRDLKDSFGNTIGTQIYDKATGALLHSVSNTNGASDPSTGTLGIVSTDGNGNPDPTQQASFLQTIPSAYQDLVRGVADGRIDPPSARTKQGAQILSWVAKYDPSLADGSGGFDGTKFAARQAYMKNLSSGTLSQGIVSANKAIQHLNSFNQAVTNLGNGPVSSTINSLGKAIEEPLSGIFNPSSPGKLNLQGIASQADTEKNGLQDEMAKFFKGTGATDVGSIESWGNTLDPNATPGSQKGAVQGALTLFSGQMNSMISQYKSTMGKDPDLGQILQPQTIQTLSNFKNAGFDVDIPGINYTDKDAWTQYGGGTQDAWNSSVDALTAAGVPLTTENILQYAQSQ